MQPEACSAVVSYGETCGRPIYTSSSDCDLQPVCLMHSRDPDKSQDQFDAEIEAILSGTSGHRHSNEAFDFRGLVFLRCSFREMTFTKIANFHGATFSQDVDFRGATFIKDAIFTGVTFTKNAYFTGTTFSKEALFSYSGLLDYAHFAGEADFSGTTFTERALFTTVPFSKDAAFYSATFAKEAAFSHASFTGDVAFRGATFTENAGFIKANFAKVADFRLATISRYADFRSAIFRDVAYFDDVTVGSRDGSSMGLAIVDFRNTQFLKPEIIRFLRANYQARSGLRARFTNCRIEDVKFDAVRWYRHENRMVLQDELDLFEQYQDASSYEEVAIAYRRLITNFEKARAYDLVEECTIGEFEMKRRNPDRYLFVEWCRPVYESFPPLRDWIGEQMSIVGIYRLASLYGTSYQRALGMLTLLLLTFGVFFGTIFDIRLAADGIAACDQSNAFERLCGGVLHALEVATLQRTLLYEPVSFWGRIIEIVEQILVTGQVALLLFALRRRFRR